MPIYYLSFQRAPPVSVLPDELVSISPTIVNDLRDEVYQPGARTSPLKITLAWIARHKGTLRTLSDEIHCRWEGPQSAYKPCSIKVPSKVSLQGVKTLHLALWVSQSESSNTGLQKGRRKEEPECQIWVYDIANLPTLEQDSLVFLPVLSAPIEVLQGVTGRSNAGKSSNTIRMFQIGSTPVVEICEESGYELDKHIWDASLHLTAYLWKAVNGKETAASLSFLNAAGLRDGLHMIELGAGTGMVSILLTAIVAQVSARSIADEGGEGSVQLTATDLSSAMPLLERNIADNRGVAEEVRLNCQPLDWSEEGQIKGTQLILVSDCTYNPTYFKPLCKTINSLLVDAKQPALCLLAKKHRHEDEEGLWVEVKQHGLQASCLAGRQDVKDGHWGLWKLQLSGSTAWSL